MDQAFLTSQSYIYIETHPSYPEFGQFPSPTDGEPHARATRLVWKQGSMYGTAALIFVYLDCAWCGHAAWNQG